MPPTSAAAYDSIGSVPPQPPSADGGHRLAVCYENENDCERGNNDHHDGSTNLCFHWKQRILITVVVAACAFVGGDWLRVKAFGPGGQAYGPSASSTASDSSVDSTLDAAASAVRQQGLLMPSGVNLGGWLSLEDWFFVGDSGAVEVATPDGSTAGTCLPPLHVDASTGPRWNSETDLLKGLAAHYGNGEGEGGGDAGDDDDEDEDERQQRRMQEEEGGWTNAVKVFHAFRSSYLDYGPHGDLATLSSLGVKHVRVPVSWCWTDEDPSTIGARGWTDEEVKEKFTCPDPFYGDHVRWPAIPKRFVERFLRKCAEHGIGATLDIHTYPGGTSIGTFSGVWPKYSRFWTYGDTANNTSTNDVGRTILKDFVSWLESMAVRDPVAFRGLRALSPMNEPAHLAGLFDGADPIIKDRETFLPPLPADLAKTYLEELNGDASKSDSSPPLTEMPDGNHLRVFLWLRDAVQTFRSSTLPQLGIQLHVNIHESVFPPDILPDRNLGDDHGHNPGPIRVVGAWWRGTTTPDERRTWAVLDMHHYHAWEPSCTGAVEGPPTGGYACFGDDDDGVGSKRAVLGECARWASVYRGTMEEECEVGLKLASAEFSASTHHSVRHACADEDTLRMTYEAQTEAAKEADVELFWWSYKMPHGGAFRYAWSFKHLMYRLGVTDRPDESLFHCGDHVTPEGEPADMSM